MDVGDTNSAYFHKVVKSRNHRSRIDYIMDSNNIQVRGSKVADVFVSHYHMFLGSDMACNNLNMDGFFSKKVSADSFSNMARPITNDEIKKAMFSIGDDRAPDGIKEVVSDNQSAFVSGRRISDNILITQELMHNYHPNIGPPRCAFKIDIQKAYDTVDCRFLKCILKGFGFNPRMIKWIIACVTSTSFSLSLNGDIHGFLKGKRGLRQGDPLSPYLFTLVTEILSLILRRKVNLSGLFRFHKHCEDIQIINVCFADDLFIFARGDVDSANIIRESLDEFKSSSGLVPNIPKSTAFFCNVPNYVKIDILNIMPFGEGVLSVKYLGVPLISSRFLTKNCKVLVEKAKHRIGDWKNKSLSFIDRLQLCKSVISSMHVYWASVLIIPKGIIYDIQSLIRGFLWYNGEYKRGKAKVAWEDICLPKREGGLGLRSFDTFNMALMTTHIWNIVSNKESIWVRWIHTYKLKHRSFWDLPVTNNASWGWLKLLQMRVLVRPFFWVTIGNGMSVSVLHDLWCSISPLSDHITPRDAYNEAPNIYVNNDDLVRWKDLNGVLSEFSVSRVWEAIRPRGNEVEWFKVVWFP
ncbi:putative RNA-directed DNA polymerase [Tanacetum coccineum]